eukprot:scaffold8916_cov122-Isochrysis_galbana.AAC.4
MAVSIRIAEGRSFLRRLCRGPPLPHAGWVGRWLLLPEMAAALSPSSCQDTQYAIYSADIKRDTRTAEEEDGARGARACSS